MSSERIDSEAQRKELTTNAGENDSMNEMTKIDTSENKSQVENDDLEKVSSLPNSVKDDKLCPTIMISSEKEDGNVELYPTKSEDIDPSMENKSEVKKEPEAAKSIIKNDLNESEAKQDLVEENSMSDAKGIVIKLESNEFRPIHHPSNFPMVIPASSTANSSKQLQEQNELHETKIQSNDGPVDTKVEGLKPTLYDVLCGRGGVTNNHIGNKRFRSLVTTYQPVYLSCRKVEKSIVAKNIVDIVHQYGGRFLKKQCQSNGAFFWTEADSKRAIEKTSQALREGLDVRQNKNRRTNKQLSSSKHRRQSKIARKRHHHHQQQQIQQKQQQIQQSKQDKVKKVHLDHSEDANKRRLKQNSKQLREQQQKQQQQQPLQKHAEVLVSTTKNIKKTQMNEDITRVYITNDAG